jgi:integrase
VPPHGEGPTPGHPWTSASGKVTIYAPTPKYDSYRLRAIFGPMQYQEASSKTWEGILHKASVLETEILTRQGKYGGQSVVWLYQQWREAHRDVWGAKHIDDTLYYLDRWVRPHLGKLRVDDLRREDLETLYARKDLAPSSEEKLRAHISAMVNWAIRRRYITGITHAELVPSKPKRRKDDNTDADGMVPVEEIPSTDQVLAVAAAAVKLRTYDGKKHTRPFQPPEHRAYMVLVSAYAGLRLGECIALQGKQVHDGLIDVTQQVIEARENEEDDSGPAVQQLTPPKWGSKRRAAVPAKAGDYLLNEWLQARAEEVGPDGLIFPAPKGGWWRQRTLDRSMWKPARLEAWGGSVFTFHDLRHHAATWLLAQGVPIADVSYLLGHKDVATTMRRYVGTSEDTLKRVRILLGTQ